MIAMPKPLTSSLEWRSLPPVYMKTISLTQGKAAIIDDQDYALVSRYKWCAHEGCTTFYAVTNAKVGGKLKTLNMSALLLNPPPGYVVDHIDRNGLNNCRSNLRIALRHQNQANHGKRNGSSTSRFKGVSWDASTSRWVAAIGHKGNMYRIGKFKDEEDAALVYNVAAQIFHGDFAVLNPV